MRKQLKKKPTKTYSAQQEEDTNKLVDEDIEGELVPSRVGEKVSTVSEAGVGEEIGTESKHIKMFQSQFCSDQLLPAIGANPADNKVPRNIAQYSKEKISKEFRAVKLELFRVTALYIGYVKLHSSPGTQRYQQEIKTEEQKEELKELFNDKDNGKYIPLLHQNFTIFELNYLYTRIKKSKLNNYSKNFIRFPEQIIPLAGYLIVFCRSGKDTKIHF